MEFEFIENKRCINRIGCHANLVSMATAEYANNYPISNQMKFTLSMQELLLNAYISVKLIKVQHRGINDISFCCQGNWASITIKL